MMNTGSQNDWILADLMEGRELTQKDAYREYGCTRLAAMISDLRRRGHKINVRYETRTNRFGGAVRFAVYSMEVGA